MLKSDTPIPSSPQPSWAITVPCEQEGETTDELTAPTSWIMAAKEPMMAALMMDWMSSSMPNTSTLL